LYCLPWRHPPCRGGMALGARRHLPEFSVGPGAAPPEVRSSLGRLPHLSGGSFLYCHCSGRTASRACLAVPPRHPPCRGGLAGAWPVLLEPLLVVCAPRRGRQRSHRDLLLRAQLLCCCPRRRMSFAPGTARASPWGMNSVAPSRGPFGSLVAGTRGAIALSIGGSLPAAMVSSLAGSAPAACVRLVRATWSRLARGPVSLAGCAPLGPSRITRIPSQKRPLDGQSGRALDAGVDGRRLLCYEAPSASTSI